MADRAADHLRCVVGFPIDWDWTGVMTELEHMAPEKIMYKRGNINQYLDDFHASLYRAMVWKYGEAEAQERFWWLWHKHKKEA